MDSGAPFWIAVLFSVITILYYTFPLVTGTAVGVLSGILLRTLPVWRAALLGFGFGLLGTAIGVASLKLYGYYWDYHAGWWDTQGWTREATVSVPCVMAVLTPAAMLLGAGHGCSGAGWARGQSRCSHWLRSRPSAWSAS